MTNTETTGRGKRRESYSFAKQRARRNKRRIEAEARQREYDKLTKDQKIERAKLRGGSVRELIRLGVNRKPRTVKA